MKSRILSFALKLFIIGIIGGFAFFIGRALNHFPKIEEKKKIIVEREICVYEAEKISNSQYEIIRRIK